MVGFGSNQKERQSTQLFLGGTESEPFSCDQAFLVGKTNIYVCGITIHNSYHIGHLRMMVSFDAIIRWLIELGYSLFFVRNVTDLDAKTLSWVEGPSSFWHTIGLMVSCFEKETGPLKTVGPDLEPRVTNYVCCIQRLIRRLVKLGSARLTENGDVLFQSHHAVPVVLKTPKRELEVGVWGKKAKASADDFAVWKSSSISEGHLNWLSPYGLGKPGWHIECSTMCQSAFRIGVDVHGGGQDLKFPHHYNETKQNDVLFKRNYVRCWIHNGLVSFGRAKMSQSVGNTAEAKSLLKMCSPEAIRFYILSSHYSSPFEYNFNQLQKAQKVWGDVSNTFLKLQYQSRREWAVDWDERGSVTFRNWMNQNACTPSAISSLLILLKLAIKRKRIVLGRQCQSLTKILGFSITQTKPSKDKKPDDCAWGAGLLVDSFLLYRCWLRSQHHFGLSDKLRLELCALGTIYDEGPTLSHWLWGTASAGN
ncbi:cysteinyl-tRNA synthetase [Candidatus Tremblaya phenacola PAVE]|nr:cysteinyl-tRNA synthetase [Candidatus Tremblaya phenacola PAVE]